VSGFHSSGQDRKIMVLVETCWQLKVGRFVLVLNLNATTVRGSGGS